MTETRYHWKLLWCVYQDGELLEAGFGTRALAEKWIADRNKPRTHDRERLPFEMTEGSGRMR